VLCDFWQRIRFVFERDTKSKVSQAIAAAKPGVTLGAGEGSGQSIQGTQTESTAVLQYSATHNGILSIDDISLNEEVKRERERERDEKRLIKQCE
jgi:hypothetical protein